MKKAILCTCVVLLCLAMGVGHATIGRVNNTVPNVDTDGTGGHYQVVETGKIDSGGNFHSDQTVQNITLLASASRTGQTSSATQTNYGYRGIIIYLDVTAASGTGGLTVNLNYINPLTGRSASTAIGSARTTASCFVCIIFPAPSLPALSGGSLTSVLPSQWNVTITVGDSSSYTYSVTADLIR